MSKMLLLSIIVALLMMLSGPAFSTGDEVAKEQNDPLVIIEKSFVIIPTSGDDPALSSMGINDDVRVFAEVVNGRSAEARNIIARCIFENSDGTVFDRQEVKVEKLAPGEKKEIIFFWPAKSNADAYRLLKRVLTVKSE